MSEVWCGEDDERELVGERFGSQPASGLAKLKYDVVSISPQPDSIR